MMLRTKLTRGRLINSRSPRSKRQFARARSSVILCKHCSASQTLCSKAKRTSCMLFGCGGTKFPWLTSKLSCWSMRATLPGTLAMCEANCPSVIDFACGFHESFCSGTLSSTLLVVATSWRNSFSIGSVIVPIRHLLQKAVSKFQRLQSFKDNSRFNFETCNLETLKPHYFYFSEQHPSFDCAINMRASRAFGSPYLSWCRTHAI